MMGNTQHCPYCAAVVCRYVSALADLANPKAALPLLADERRLAAYEAAIAAALIEQPGAGRRLVLDF